jgi:hypothetical protein
MAKAKTLSQLLEEQNRLAVRHSDAHNGETVRVLVEAVYVGPGMRSIGRCRVGDIITVAGGWYVDSLVADGLATRDLGVTLTDAEGGPEFADTGDEALPAKPKPKRKAPPKPRANVG